VQLVATVERRELLELLDQVVLVSLELRELLVEPVVLVVQVMPVV
jgi:hypothetical protein